MQLTQKYDLLFLTVTLAYQGATVDVADVLIDTGSVGTILAADQVAAVGIVPLPEDPLVSIRGVGGSETVFRRQVDYLQAGEKQLAGFLIEVGGMDYGFEINGILGMDFLTRAGAVLNLQTLQMTYADK